MDRNDAVAEKERPESETMNKRDLHEAKNSGQTD